ncbi:alpha-2-macroglobulin family protein [Sulfitobacter sp. HNIBRBA3233]|uniref:alpha-2-macroglobulin family protein n=1 Tax=Sulfitobacter marinivivus TaxID=3158558 RepID=UPI0032DF1318
MSGLCRLLWFLALSVLVSLPARAQDALPDHRYLVSENTDFYGADLGPLFDTSRAACVRACDSQSACVAYTFNSRSNACFPKSALTDSQPFEGAISARKVPTPAAARALGTARAAELSFLAPDDIAAASALVTTLANDTPVGDLRIPDVVAAFNAALSTGNRPAAARRAAQAAVIDDSADSWQRLAWLGLRPAPDSTPRALVNRLRAQSVPAAINAYLRADTTAARVTALDLMARAFEANGRGRSMIAPLRLAATLEPRAEIAAALETAIGKYGFRLTDTRVDKDSARPRICAVFSEDLVQAGVDYAPFVRTEDPTLSVAPDDREICIEGVSHGARYRVTFRSGLPAASGEVLHRDTPVTLYVRDRPATVRFSGRAYVLPRSADAALPVETVNTDAVELVLRRISDRNLLRAMQDSYFGRPLSKYQEDAFATDIAEHIWTGTGTVQNTLNAQVTTRLPLGDMLAGQRAGIYALSASIAGQDPYDNPAATQWFILTDLGLSAWSGTDGLYAAVRGLGDTGARAGVTLTLLSRANAVLGTAVTDAEGFARFPAGLTRGTGAAAPALLMAEEGETDAAFLSLRDPGFDLSDRGVEGHPPSPPIDTFLTTDRGAYRAGEVIHATVLTRDPAGKAVNGLPLVAVLTRPDGVEHSRTLSQGARDGGHVFALPTGPLAPRGAWRLDVVADPAMGPLASQTVLVEDFLPDRITFDMTLPDAPLRLGDRPPLAVAASYLFGSPGAGLAVEGEARLRLTRSLDAHPGYLFGRHDTRFDTRTAYLDPVTTDARGAATLALTLPDLDEVPAAPLEAEITLRVAEGSGRPVERSLTRPVATGAPLIGIKPDFEGPLSEGADAAFRLIATAGDMPVRWTLNRVETRYQWFSRYGDWDWEPVTRRIRMDSGEVTLGQTPTALELPTDWGQYELVVERLGAPYAVSSVSFSAGWYGGGDAADTPDLLQVSLDRPDYGRGDTATLRFSAPQEGVALVSVLSNRVIEQRAVAVPQGDFALPLTVTEDWGHSAYVTVQLLRPMDAAADQSPQRSLGLAHARIRPEGKELTVTLDAPAEVDGQAGPLDVPVRIDGIAEGAQAHLTLAAVDVGILNLTGFAAPDPTDHYFGQRRLGVEIRDIYGRLIDGLNGAMGQVRSGGDAARSAGLQAPPPTEALMAAFSGPVTVGPDGTATVRIARPAFNGTIRLMAVAWSDSAVGRAVQDVIARDPVVITGSVPRVLAPGDDTTMLLEFVHASGGAGEMPVSVLADAGIAVGAFPATVAIDPGGTVRLAVPLSAREIGDHQITVTLRPPGGAPLQRVLSLPVRINDPEIAVTRRFSLGAGETFTYDTAPFAGLRAGTASATLTAGPLARFDVPGLLRQLDRYPYGCTEQVTSGALPLLGLGALASEAGLGAPQDIKAKIQSGVDQVLARQASNGAFGLWRADGGNTWLDAYVTDFLWRARGAGHDVPQRALSLALDHLRNRVNFAPDFDSGGEDIAYALLVLARAGAAQMGDLRYYADTKSDAFATPMAAAQLGAALAAYGDPARADRMFRRAASLLATPPDTTRWRDDFGSRLRDTASLVHLAAEAGSTAVDAASLAQTLPLANLTLSTQEAAQVVLAAQALGSPRSASGVEIDGAPVPATHVQRLSDRDPRSHTVRNTSGAAIDVTLTTFGVPVQPPEAQGYGYALTRRLFTLEGSEVTGPVASGTRLVVVLEVQPFEDIGARLMIDDPLPGGLEIDNPNLLRSGDVAALDWLDVATPEMTQFRSDRFLAALDHRSAEPVQLAYIVRAVSPGSYHHPAAQVSDMYRPEYRAVTATTRLTVTR